MHSCLSQRVGYHVSLRFFVDSCCASEDHDSIGVEKFGGEVSSKQTGVKIDLIHESDFLDVICIFDASASPSTSSDQDSTILEAQPANTINHSPIILLYFLLPLNNDVFLGQFMRLKVHIDHIVLRKNGHNPAPELSTSSNA